MNIRSTFNILATCVVILALPLASAAAETDCPGDPTARVQNQKSGPKSWYISFVASYDTDGVLNDQGECEWTEEQGVNTGALRHFYIKVTNKLQFSTVLEWDYLDDNISYASGIDVPWYVPGPFKYEAHVVDDEGARSRTTTGQLNQARY